MKTLMVNNCLPNSGIGQYSLKLYESLLRLDGEIELVSWEGRLMNSLYRRLRNHPWIGYSYEIPRALSQLGFIYSIPKKYQLYHITTAGFSLCFRRLRPFVATVHDLIQYSSPRWSGDVLMRAIMAGLVNARGIICVSEYSRGELLKFFNVDPAVVKVVYNGIDHEQFRPRDRQEARLTLGLDAGKWIVLHVGSEEPRKNVPALIRAFHRFQKQVPDSLLVRVGERTAVSSRLIADLGLEDKVRYFANVPSPAPFYNAADIFVFPSTLEGFGFPPLEAMACGCPVLTSNVTSLPEVAGDAAMQFDPEEDEAFAAGMEKVYADGTLRNGMIARGYEQCRPFTWQRCAAETLEVYQAAAA